MNESRIAANVPDPLPVDWDAVIGQLLVINGFVFIGLLLYIINIAKLVRSKDGVSGKNAVRTIGIFIPIIGIVMALF